MCPNVSTTGEEWALVIGGADSELAELRVRRWLREYGDRLRGREGNELNLKLLYGDCVLDEEGSVDRRGVEGRAVVLSSGPSSLSSSSSLNCARSFSGLSIARKGGVSAACDVMVIVFLDERR